MNDFMKAEMLNIRLVLNNFLQRMEYAALQDDEKIDAKEAKTLRKIEKATNRYIREIDRLL